MRGRAQNWNGGGATTTRDRSHTQQGPFVNVGRAAAGASALLRRLSAGRCTLHVGRRLVLLGRRYSCVLALQRLLSVTTNERTGLKNAHPASSLFRTPTPSKLC